MSSASGAGGTSRRYHGAHGQAEGSLERERSLLRQANDQLKRCQIALFRYRQNEPRNNQNTAISHSLEMSGGRSRREKLKTQGDLIGIGESSVDYMGSA